MIGIDFQTLLKTYGGRCLAKMLGQRDLRRNLLHTNFDVDHSWFGPVHIFDKDLLAVVVLVVVIVLLARSRSPRQTGK